MQRPFLLNISQEAEQWDTDQDIVSYSIIANKKCSLQKRNNVWAKLNLPPRPFQGSQTCMSLLCSRKFKIKHCSLLS